jgi:hypothetical protein
VCLCGPFSILLKPISFFCVLSMNNASAAELLRWEEPQASPNVKTWNYKGVSKSFRIESITKCTVTTINTR